LKEGHRSISGTEIIGLVKGKKFAWEEAIAIFTIIRSPMIFTTLFFGGYIKLNFKIFLNIFSINKYKYHKQLKGEKRAARW
jgi:hypothetical protein